MRLVANAAFRDIYANAYRKPGEEFEAKEIVAKEFLDKGLARRKAQRKAAKTKEQ